MQTNKTTFAVKARRILPLADEKAARGSQLFGRLKSIDNAVLIVHAGQVVALGKAREIRLPGDCELTDLGPVCLIPGTINAHTHLDLSYLAEKTTWRKGFSAWLQSLIPLLPRGQIPPETLTQAIHKACQDLAAYGTAHVGNIAGSADHLLAATDDSARQAGFGISHFCECFGFAQSQDETNADLWPPFVRRDLQERPELAERVAPAGHALYSTSAEKLVRAKQFCRKHARVFSLHLAESPEETEMLTLGRGSLFEIFRQSILPEHWQAPGKRPLAYACQLNLLGARTLAVHGVDLDAQEAQVLAATGAALCLCPRSNQHLGVGSADVKTLIEENVLLCLGTDGLTSNTDLDVCQEALFLQEQADIPGEALIRMLTVNAARALGLGKNAGRLVPGAAANFCILPQQFLF
ncbi:MAG: amidohydrolase family protein [Desulfovibrio sp.]|nr:amidohydrolase family protein [Desulfovibrio sp.]